MGDFADGHGETVYRYAANEYRRVEDLANLVAKFASASDVLHGRERAVRTFTLMGGLKGPPSACSCAQNRVDVFGVGDPRTVYRWSLVGSTRSGPDALPVGPTAIPAPGVGS